MKRQILTNSVLTEKEKLYEILGLAFADKIFSSPEFEVVRINKDSFDSKECRNLLKTHGDLIVSKQDAKKRYIKVKAQEFYTGTVPFEKYSMYNPDNKSHRDGWGETLTDCDAIYFLYFNLNDDSGLMSWEKTPVNTRVSLLCVPMKRFQRFMNESASIIYPNEPKYNDYPLVASKKINSQKQEVLSYSRQVQIRDLLKYVKSTSEYDLSFSFNIYHLEKCLFNYRITNDLGKFAKEVAAIAFDPKKLKLMNSHEKIQNDRFVCHWYGQEFNISEWEFYDKYSIEQKAANDVDNKTKHFNQKKFNKIICKKAMQEFKIFA